jgi:phosphate transport system substrate-binding protein
MNKVKLILCGFFTMFIVQSCKQAANKKVDEPDSGTVQVAVDESFQPIVDEELSVFKYLNPKARPNMIYASENDALRLLLNDSVRMIILSRELTKTEINILAAKQLGPLSNRFAIDGVALIVNQVSKDTLITVAEIKKMLAGQAKTGVNIVFDNANSSLARYLKAFSGVNDLKLKNIYALKNNKEVIKYVSQNPNSLGITGFSWLNDPDADYAAAVQKVKIMGVKDESSKQWPNQYFTPSQTTFALKQYPLSRGLYVINCTGKQGLGMGIAHFLVSDRGQRIILRSGLLPDVIPGREITIKHTFDN